MTVQGAIEHARKVAREKRADADWKWRHGRLNADDCISCAEEHEQLAEWLEELERYRALGVTPEMIEAMQGHNIALINDLGEYQALGTVEELKEAREKQVAKFVECKEWKGYRDTRYKCPRCGKNVRNDETYCHKCGQAVKFPKIKVVDNKVKLDWSEEDEND